MNIQIPDFDNIHVLIVGDVMLDLYWNGDTSRISPESPIPIVHIRTRDQRPGGAANVALNVKALGAKTTLMGMVGNDADGALLQKILEEKNIQCVFQKTLIAPTVTKLRILSRNQQLLRVDFEEKPITFSTRKLLDDFEEHIAQADVVILSDYSKGTLENAVALIEAAREKNIPVLIDPKRDSFAHYRGATILTPNMKEFQDVVGPVKSLKELESKAREQLELNNLDALLVTRSEHGMSLIQRGHDAVHIPTQAKEVYDVTGAGDTVISTLAAAIATGQDWPHAMSLANLAAGISVSKVGAAVVTVPEIRRALHEEHLSGASIVNKDQLQVLVKDAQAHGETVVMTNGCFDILHAGHIAYLEEAKQLGHRLIVAVNSDASVIRLKGASRPINSLDQRMTVLAGLKSVDWVVPFSEDTPEKLIAEILPNILVKGGDYAIADIAGAAQVLENGGDVKVLVFKEGLSTSKIINKVKEGST